MALGEKYHTGVIWQDFQHRQLMDLFYKLKQAKSGAARDDGLFKYSLAFLAMYVNHHFKLGEEYMDIYYYPETDAHKKEHKTLIKEIKRFRNDLSHTDDAAVQKLLLTVNNWILNHILGDDKTLGDYILACEKKQFSQP